MPHGAHNRVSLDTMVSISIIPWYVHPKEKDPRLFQDLTRCGARHGLAVCGRSLAAKATRQTHRTMACLTLRPALLVTDVVAAWRRAQANEAPPGTLSKEDNEARVALLKNHDVLERVSGVFCTCYR